MNKYLSLCRFTNKTVSALTDLTASRKPHQPTMQHQPLQPPTNIIYIVNNCAVFNNCQVTRRKTEIRHAASFTVLVYVCILVSVCLSVCFSVSLSLSVLGVGCGGGQ